MFTKTSDNQKTYFYADDRPVAEMADAPGHSVLLKRSNGCEPKDWAAIVNHLEPGRFVPVTRSMILTPEEADHLRNSIPTEEQK